MLIISIVEESWFDVSFVAIFFGCVVINVSGILFVFGVWMVCVFVLNIVGIELVVFLFSFTFLSSITVSRFSVGMLYVCVFGAWSEASLYEQFCTVLIFNISCRCFIMGQFLLVERWGWLQLMHWICLQGVGSWMVEAHISQFSVPLQYLRVCPSFKHFLHWMGLGMYGSILQFINPILISLGSLYRLKSRICRGVFFDSLSINFVIFLQLTTPWSLRPSIISSSLRSRSVGAKITPLIVFRVLCRENSISQTPVARFSNF